MANPLIAICQMTSTNDKEKNLQTVCEIVSKAKARSACVSINIRYFINGFFNIFNHINF